MFEILSTSQISSYLIGDDYANWTYEEAKALSEYYEDLELELGEEILFDRVAIRCDWNKYKSISDIADDYEAISSTDTIDNLYDYFNAVIEIVNTDGCGAEYKTYLITNN